MLGNGKPVSGGRVSQCTTRGKFQKLELDSSRVLTGILHHIKGSGTLLDPYYWDPSLPLPFSFGNVANAGGQWKELTMRRGTCEVRFKLAAVHRSCGMSSKG